MNAYALDLHFNCFDQLSLHYRIAISSADSECGVSDHFLHQQRRDTGMCAYPKLQAFHVFVSGVGRTGKSLLNEAITAEVDTIWADEANSLTRCVAAPTGIWIRQRAPCRCNSRGEAKKELMWSGAKLLTQVVLPRFLPKALHRHSLRGRGVYLYWAVASRGIQGWQKPYHVGSVDYRTVVNNIPAYYRWHKLHGRCHG